MDFVETWVGLCQELTDANEELLEVSGLTALSTVSYNVIIPMTTDLRPFSENENTGKKLNIWTLIIGKTRLSRKTTVMRFLHDFILSVMGPNYLCPYLSTPEALLEELSFHPIKTWLIDEFAIILEQCRKKDYMADFQGILQKLYDGTTITRRTRGRGFLKIENPYFSIMATTTPYTIKEKLLDEKMFIHGFLNRFLIIWDEGAKHLVPVGERLLSLLPLKNNEIIQLKEKAKKIMKKEIIFIWFDKETRNLLNQFDQQIYASIKKSTDEVAIAYYGNLTDFIIKISALYRISRAIEKELDKPTITVEKEDFTKAYKFIWNTILPSFKTLREQVKLAKTVKPMTIESIEDYIETVKDIVRKHGEKRNGYYVIEKHRLTKLWNGRTHSTVRELNKVLATLDAMGEVEQKLEKSKQGRPRWMYYFKI